MVEEFGAGRWSQQPGAAPLGAEGGFAQQSEGTRPVGRVHFKGVLRKQPDNAREQRRLARSEDGFAPLAAAVYKQPEERPLEEDIVGNGVDGSFLDDVDDVVALQIRSLGNCR